MKPSLLWRLFGHLDKGIPPYLCHVCKRPGKWRLFRADAVCDWACDRHLAAVTWALMRHWRESDPLTVTKAQSGPPQQPPTERTA